MMMTKINNFYNIDVLYFEFNKKIYIYVNRHKYIFFNADLPWASSKSTWSFFWSSEEKTATIEEILYLKWHEKSKMECLVYEQQECMCFLCTPLPKFYLVYWLCIIERYIPHHSKIYHSCSKNGKDIRWADAAGNYSLGIQLYKTLLPNDVGNINRKCWFSSYSNQITSQCCSL